MFWKFLREKRCLRALSLASQRDVRTSRVSKAAGDHCGVTRHFAFSGRYVPRSPRYVVHTSPTETPPFSLFLSPTHTHSHSLTCSVTHSIQYPHTPTGSLESCDHHGESSLPRGREDAKHQEAFGVVRLQQKHTLWKTSMTICE